MSNDQDVRHINIAVNAPSKPERIEIVVNIADEQPIAARENNNHNIEVKFEGPVMPKISEEALFKSLFEIARDNIERR